MSNPKHGSFRRFLCPTDFSETSEEAFLLAEQLAASVGATLVILHVFNLPSDWGIRASPDVVDERIQSQLENVKPQTSGVSTEHVAFGGSPGPVICWMAQQRACDLIVIGTHGRTGLFHLMLGSVAEYVVRHAPCPVLTVRHTEQRQPVEAPEVHLPLPPME